MAAATQQAEKAVAAERDERRALEKRLAGEAETRTRRRRVRGSVALGTLTLIALVLLLALEVVTGTWPVAILVTAVAMLLSIAMRIGLGNQRGNEALVWIGLLVGISGTVLAIVLALADKP